MQHIILYIVHMHTYMYINIHIHIYTLCISICIYLMISSLQLNHCIGQKVHNILGKNPNELFGQPNTLVQYIFKEFSI